LLVQGGQPYRAFPCSKASLTLVIIFVSISPLYESILTYFSIYLFSFHLSPVSCLFLFLFYLSLPVCDFISCSAPLCIIYLFFSSSSFPFSIFLFPPDSLPLFNFFSLVLLFSYSLCFFQNLSLSLSLSLCISLSVCLSVSPGLPFTFTFYF